MSFSPPLLADRYQLLEEIGRGGHAAVHRARDQRLGRDVAVKLLRDEAPSDNVLARFEREIRLTATLEHPHILHVHDTGVHEGRPFLVMELASGGTLADRLARESPLPILDALQVTRDVGLALAHAHAHGVVHRDVKPANILLRDGIALLADFGVAFAEPEALQRRLTSAGLAVGTAQYMSPEQLCADPGVDARSDQYSLALVLYELLAGVPAQTARTLEGLRLQRLAAPPLGVRTHRPSVPEAIEQALTTALAPVPADRFRDVPAFLAALGISASGEFRVPGTGGYAAVGASSGAMGRRVGDADVREAGVHATTSAQSSATGRGARTVGMLALGVVALVGTAWGVRQWDGADVAGTSAAGEGALAGATTAAGEEDDLTRVAVTLAPPASDSLSRRLHRALEAEFGAWPDVALGAGAPAWRVTSEATSLGDSMRVRLTVARERGTPRQLAAVGGAATDEQVRALSARLVREVLAGAGEDDAPGLAALPVRSLRAARAYAAGHRALRAGALEDAEQRWRRVVEDAPTFAHAAFWAAQVASWRQPRERDAWSGLVATAQARAAQEELDTLLVQGLLAMAQADHPAACRAYKEATARAPASFVAWFGLGECQRQDNVVLRRGAQLVHRAGMHGALQAYRRMLETVPTAELLAVLWPTLFRATFAEANRTRAGVVEGGASREQTLAYASLANDTLAFTPVPAAQFASSAVPASFTSAVRTGRRTAADLTRRWVERFPTSSDGWLAHAEALELGGDLSRAAAGVARIEDAVQRVRVDDLTPSVRLRTLTIAVRLAVRQGALAEAKVRAQAVLDDPVLRTDSTLAGALAPFAAFVGDTTWLLATMEQLRVRELPRALGTALARYHARAALGECNGLVEERAQVLRLLASSVPAADTARVRAQAVVAADRYAVPCLADDVARDLPPTIAFFRAVRSLAAGDTASALAQLDDGRAGRAGVTDGTVSWDQVWLEAWLRSASGDSSGTVRYLVRAFESLGEISSLAFENASHAAGLRRAALLLDALSSRVGTTEATRAWTDRVRAYRESPVLQEEG